MKNKKTMDETTNRKVYNRSRKEYLAKKHGLCSYCGYHKGENKRGKWYGGFDEDELKHPSWKLVSKKRKQYQGDKLNLITKERNISINGETWYYFEYKW